MSRKEKFIEKIFSMKGVRFAPQEDENVLKVSIYDNALVITINIVNRTVKITQNDNEVPNIKELDDEIKASTDDFILMAKAYLRGFYQGSFLFLF